jgi:hypothetical protein
MVLCTRNNAEVHYIWSLIKRLNLFQKNFKKKAREIKKFFSLTYKRSQVHCIIDKRKHKRRWKFSKKILKFLSREIRKRSFCTRFERKYVKLTNEREKKERHVPRHIELTAVLREILKQKNKSNRRRDFKPLDLQSNK